MNLPRTIGITALVCSAFGLYYNASSLSGSFQGVFAETLKKGDQPYFYPAFYLMSAICIVCYGLLFWCGLQFVRGQLNLSRLFVRLLMFEVVYFFSIGFLWMIPGIGMSVGGATGVANGGLMLQFIILFPLWAPFAIRRAQKRQLLENSAV